ncbi:FtsX-like permease family protein [Shewanella sp. 1_MG-2023]|uniref:FtsX-like permease family protein n=1 Tax=Shewanella electrodiphila TaxID=934143 RepID=A0ABT0KL17_9GAMM|nr:MULTISPECIES: FtsX-like permease family protein [Shewanella]MCL1044532.1 FtsX-like permease family protein [Shewanella electrodiphila]MDO6610394.1 FtsX-like permease family protein [Shewanella sp. 7_MG-2023]MDO6770519.1 FtsX-like permease family protein [Shewanella sp. 2_MG-2023]MDO6794406.1 FtsX-like permease family protein [Shewanella sp. 1_MG-2023]
MLHIKPILSSLMRSKSGPVLLLLQIILSVAIVANASFIIHERLTMMQRDSGLMEEQVLSFNVYNFDPAIDNIQQNVIDQQILRGLPNVIDASSTNMMPLSGSGWMDRYVDSADEDTAKSMPGFALYLGNEHLLNVMGAKLIEGRNFRPEEINTQLDQSGMVAMVSKPLAEEFWGDESPVGKIMYQGAQTIEIIGVIEKLQGAWVNHENFEYSVIQNIDFGGGLKNKTYMVRALPEHIPALEEAIVKAFHAENPNRVIDGFSSLLDMKKESYSNHRLMATLLSMMVILLLLITALGLTGMVMFNIQRRTKQIGTRRALGAKKRDIVNFFMVENYMICLAGGVIGGLLSLQLGQQLMSLYSLPMLPMTYPIAAIAGLLIVTTLAVIFPALKAAKISPAMATRSV